MMIRRFHLFWSIFVGALFISNAMSPAAVILDQASLSTDYHLVSGTVTVVDIDTLRVDSFTYDGQGIDVFFYLGSENTSEAFTSGLQIGPQLLHTSFDGTGGPLTIDLPVGESLENYGAISVWCTLAGISFGSGTFVSVPETAVTGLATLSTLVLLRRRRSRHRGLLSGSDGGRKRG
jgi:hypothetical protein